MAGTLPPAATAGAAGGEQMPPSLVGEVTDSGCIRRRLGASGLVLFLILFDVACCGIVQGT
jgi:hypothetical protein